MATQKVQKKACQQFFSLAFLLGLGVACNDNASFKSNTVSNRKPDIQTADGYVKTNSVATIDKPSSGDSTSMSPSPNPTEPPNLTPSASPAAPSPTATVSPTPTLPPPPPPPHPSPTPSSDPIGAVTQGNFTVWAVPPNPAVGQSYMVHVLVRLPANVASLPASDVTGSIAGTDYWQQDIGVKGDSCLKHFSQCSDYYYYGATAEMVTLVPGALKANVTDTIKVSSAMLHEQQTISLVFSGSNPVAEAPLNEDEQLIQSYGRLYLNRTMEKTAIDYFIGTLNTPTARAGKINVKLSMLASDEFYKNSGSSAKAFVDAIYLAILRRHADPAGEGTFVAIVNASGRAQAALVMLQSAEYQNLDLP